MIQIGQTALMAALKANHLDIVQYLVMKGANINLQEQVQTKYLLYFIPNLMYDMRQDGSTALLLATIIGDKTSVQLLVEKGANIDDQNKVI